jgi:hypothetical protein
MKQVAVITRFHYPKGHPDFKWRLDFYKNEVFPRLLTQIDQEFDIWLWIEPHHEKQVKFDPRINTFTVDCNVRKNQYGHFIDHTPWSKVKGLPKYDVQVGLDSDDLVEPKFISKIKRLATGNKSIHISFQPIKMDMKTGKKYQMRFCGNKTKYNAENGTSPVFAIYQPRKDKYKFAYEHDHLFIFKHFDMLKLVGEGYVYMGIHGKNDSTRITKKDIPLGIETDKLDVVYPLRHSEWGEIEYSLKTLKFIEHNKVVIIGEKPKAKVDLHIPVDDIYNKANQNVIRKILMICDNPEVSEDFIIMNDDFFF